MNFFKSYIKSVSIFLLAWFSVLWVYAALSTVNSGDPLTASGWNEIVWKLTSVNINSDDLVTKSYVDSQISANGGWVSFAGYTTATYNGNMWGFGGPTKKCQLEFPWSRICSTQDLVKSWADNPSAKSWVMDYTRYEAYNCTYWITNTNNSGWAFRWTVISTSWNTSIDYCNESYSIACCNG